MKWLWSPRSIIERTSDGTLWTAGHPGHPYFWGWWFFRVYKTPLGWCKDTAVVWSFTKWPDDAVIVKPARR